MLVHLVGDIHQPLHVGALYYNSKCRKIVDPNVAGAGLKKFGIGSTFLGTTGGNDLMYTATQSLHHFWDSNAVTGAAAIMERTLKTKEKLDPEQLADGIVDHPPSGWETSGDPDTWPAQWATELLVLSTDALTEPDFEDASRKTSERGTTCTASVAIDKDYKNYAYKTALDQLGKAGFRLDALLVKIFEGQ